MMDKDEKIPEGVIGPLNLIEMIFWGIPRDEEEVETMTTVEVMAHLKVSRAQLTKWSNSGDLRPISRGKYDAAAVHSFVPRSSPNEHHGLQDDA